MLNQHCLFYHGNLNSEAPGDSQTAFVHGEMLQAITNKHGCCRHGCQSPQGGCCCLGRPGSRLKGLLGEPGAVLGQTARQFSRKSPICCKIAPPRHQVQLLLHLLCSPLLHLLCGPVVLRESFVHTVHVQGAWLHCSAGAM